MLKMVTSVLIAVVIFLQVFTAFSVLLNWSFPVAFLAWLASLCLFLFLFRKASPPITFSKKTVLDCLFLSTLATLVIPFFSLQETHYHYDEQITAFTSVSLSSLATLNWFSAVPDHFFCCPRVY